MQWQDTFKEGDKEFKAGNYRKAEEKFSLALNEIEKLRINDSNLIEVLSKLGKTYCKLAKFADSETVYKRAKKLAEAISDVQSLTNILQGLGELCLELGNYETAEILIKEALNIRKQLNSEPLTLAEAYNALGDLYIIQEKLTQAEEFLNLAYKIRKEKLSSSDPDIAETLSNIALLKMRQGKYDEVESLQQEACLIWEKSLGTGHPKFASGINNKATTIKNRGKYDEAETLYRNAIEIWIKVFGIDHPEVAAGFNNLGNLLNEIGRYKEAESLLNQALTIYTVKGCKE